jgi:hypothetical protein
VSPRRGCVPVRMIRRRCSESVATCPSAGRRFAQSGVRRQADLDRVPPLNPHAHILNVTVESGEELPLSVVEAERRLGIGRALVDEPPNAREIDSVPVGRRRGAAATLARFEERCRSEAG